MCSLSRFSLFSLNARFDRFTNPCVLGVLAAPWRSFCGGWGVGGGVAISYTILLNFIQSLVSKFVMDGVNINKLCVAINNIDSPLVLWFTFTWTISEIHKINLKE